MTTETRLTGRITDEQIAALQRKVGVTRKPDYQEWELDDARIFRSQLRHWAVLTGDMRPLYLDPDYAATTPWKTLIAPAGIIVCYEQLDPEVDCLPDSVAVLASAKVEWAEPIRLGDSIFPESVIESVVEVTKGTGEGRVVAQQIRTEVRNQRSTTAGHAVLTWHCYERGSSAHRALFGMREDAHYYNRSDIELLSVEYAAEQSRGPGLLYWEDVSEGEEVPHILKGPTTREVIQPP